MAEPLKKDEALAAAVREAFQRHMEAARQASQALKEKQAIAPSASLTLPAAAPAPHRDTRLAVPKPANEGRAPALAPVAEPVKSVETPSLSRLVAIASPQKIAESPAATAPIASTAPKGISAPVEVPAADIRPAPAIETAQVPTAETARVQAAPEPVLIQAPEPVPSAAVSEEGTDPSLDFGEALFFEVAPDADGSLEDEAPRMPKAASLETPLRDPVTQRGADDLEFRQPPSRERPRMSTVNPAAGPPQDLDVLDKPPPVAPPQPVEITPAVSKIEKAVELPVKPAAAKTATRFGIAAPVRPAAVNANRARRGKFKIPTALVASVVLGAAIIGVGGYVWANPDKLQALGALVAPPAQNQVASAAVETKPVQADSKISTPLPVTRVASVPAAPPSSLAPVALPAPSAPAATRSVSTISITLDEVDEAVQSARELISNGDIDGARQALESYKTGSDPRALFALAETYDPAIVKDPSKADPAQAKSFYEAAARAGSQDNTADRIARLALAHAN